MARLILLDSGPLGLIVRALPAGRKSCVVSHGCRPSGQAARSSSSPRLPITRCAANCFASAPSAACDGWSMHSIRAAVLTPDPVDRRDHQGRGVLGLPPTVGHPHGVARRSRCRCHPCRPSGARRPARGYRHDRDDEPGALEPVPRNRRPDLGSDPVDIYNQNGDDRDRTGNLLVANQALSQLSYVPDLGGRHFPAGGGDDSMRPIDDSVSLVT